MIEQIVQWVLEFIDKLIGYSPNDDAYDEKKVTWTAEDIQRREASRKMHEEGQTNNAVL
jgi:hypothetical protein